MEKSMKIEKLHRSVLPLQDVIWVKAGKEILLEGRMFDIEKYSISGSEMTVYGLFDKKENKLNSHFYGYKKHTAGNITGAGVLHIIFTCFFQPDPQNYPIHAAFRDCLPFNSFSYMPQEIYMAVISPPPDYF